MDYVLFGMGYGATLMLLGWALRTFGPERKYKDVNPEDIDLTLERQRWVRFVQGLGGVIAIAGTAMVLFTFIIMLVNPDDETGGFIALVIWGFLAIALLIWCWFYVSSFGLQGIWSREEGYGFRGTSTPGPAAVPSGRISTARVITTPDGPDSDPEENEVDSPMPSESSPAEAPDQEAEEIEPAHDIIGPSMNESTASEPKDDTLDASAVEPDPEYDFGDGSDTTVPSEIGGRAEAIRRLQGRQKRTGKSPDSEE